MRRNSIYGAASMSFLVWARAIKILRKSAKMRRSLLLERVSNEEIVWDRRLFVIRKSVWIGDYLG